MAANGQSPRQVFARVALLLALYGCVVWYFSDGVIEALVILLVTFAALLSEKA